MTGLKDSMGSSEFLFPREPRCSTLRGTLRVKGKQNSQVTVGPIVKCFVIPPHSKIEGQNCKKSICLTPDGAQIYLGFEIHVLVT